jgi:hypothetical protein
VKLHLPSGPSIQSATYVTAMPMPPLASISSTNPQIAHLLLHPDSQVRWLRCQPLQLAQLWAC